MKKNFIIIVYVIICLACYLLVRMNFDNNIKHYMQNGKRIKDYAVDVFPVLDELPEYKEIEYQYTKVGYTFGFSETMLLRVKYNNQTYECEKRKLSDTFVYLDYIVKSGDSFKIPEYKFSINNYEFKVINQELDDMEEYPSYFGMIATSNKDYSIVYLYHCNSELDCISLHEEVDPMQKFVKKHFRYDW